MRAAPSTTDRTNTILLGLLLVVAFVAGGSNRPDSLSQVSVRSAAIMIGCTALLRLAPGDLRGIRPILLIVTSYFAATLIQLIPLPPAIWTALPMRDVFAETALAAGMPQPWRPISLVPEATVNSSLACLPAFAALLCLCRMTTRDGPSIVALIVALTLLSGVVGVLQITTGQMYFYGGNDHENAVGLLANRNHQAALLAAMLPALVVLVGLGPSSLAVTIRSTLAIVTALFLVPLVFVTGSRAGLILLLVGLAGAVALAMTVRRLPAIRATVAQRSGRRPYTARIILIAGAAALVLVVALTILTSRDVAIQRLFAKDIEGDSRLLLFRPMIEIASSAFPFGTGFGSFAAVFKVYEPAWKLGPTYFNHAHNDILEIIIEGGVVGIALAAAFVLWWSVTTVKLWRTSATRPALLLGRLGSIQTFIFMIASLSDYPLRVPLCQLVFLVSATLMALGGRPALTSTTSERTY